MSNVTKCPLTKLKLSTAKKEEEVFHSFFQQSNNKTKQFFFEMEGKYSRTRKTYTKVI